jgi:hypothetical protein
MEHADVIRSGMMVFQSPMYAKFGIGGERLLRSLQEWAFCGNCLRQSEVVTMAGNRQVPTSRWADHHCCYAQDWQTGRGLID